MEAKKRLIKFLRLSLERPSSVEIVLALLWFTLAIITFSNAGADFLCFLVLIFGGMVMGAIWALRGLFHLVRYVFRSEDRGLAFRRLVAWSVLPIIVVLAMGAKVKQEKLLTIRLKLSEAALLEFVQNVPADTNEEFSKKKQWVGLFHLSDVQDIDGCVRFITTNDILDDAGLAYSPKGKPPVLGEDYYWHLYGPWWLWERSW
ncbi:MAG: hypothetical protein KAT11_02325 [Phycisphaerae bacterium]|nr:hypothetical protein [Phycisphaerae bacterium]